MKKFLTVYWLIPAHPERELFGDIIRILAKQFNAPHFEPHLTILATPAKDREDPGKVLPRIKASPLRLKTYGFGHSPKFTKTLFVKFQPSKQLKKLVFDLAAATHSRVKSPSDPHLSLIYKKLPASVKKGLASTIKLPFSEVNFDSIKAMRCASPTTTRDDVEAWQEMTTRHLIS